MGLQWRQDGEDRWIAPCSDGRWIVERHAASIKPLKRCDTYTTAFECDKLYATVSIPVYTLEEAQKRAEWITAAILGTIKPLGEFAEGEEVWIKAEIAMIDRDDSTVEVHWDTEFTSDPAWINSDVKARKA